MPAKLDISDAAAVPFKCLLHAHLPAAVVLDAHVGVDQNLHNAVTRSVFLVLFFFFFFISVHHSVSPSIQFH